MEQKKQEPIRDARQLGTAKMLVLGLQHMFAMFGFPTRRSSDLLQFLYLFLYRGIFRKLAGSH